MELIFENVEERDKVIKHNCPKLFGGKNDFYCHAPYTYEKCKKCWEQSGVKYRIKGPTPDRPVPIEEQEKSYTEIVIQEPLKPGDRLVKKDGIWGIEKKPEPYLKVDVPKPDITPNEHWMDKKVEDYIREVTRGDIQMFVMPGRAQGKTEMRRRMEEAQQRLIMENSVFGVSGPVSSYSVLAKLDYEYRHNKNWKEAIDIFMDKHDRIKKPQIEKIIWNGPATIVFWKDGTKTVVKCADCDVPDYEKGLAMAICKKVYGEGYWTNIFKRYLYDDGPMLPEHPEPLSPEGQVEQLIKELDRAIYDLFNVPTHIRTEAPLKIPYLLYGQKIIPTDKVVVKTPTVAAPEPLEPCEDCKHEDVHEWDEPCRSCSGNSNFVRKEEKKKEEPFKACVDCKYGPNPANKYCIGCTVHDGLQNYEPKEEKKEVEKCCKNCEYGSMPKDIGACWSCNGYPIYSNFRAAEK